MLCKVSFSIISFNIIKTILFVNQLMTIKQTHFFPKVILIPADKDNGGIRSKLQVRINMLHTISSEYTGGFRINYAGEYPAPHSGALADRLSSSETVKDSLKDSVDISPQARALAEKYSLILDGNSTGKEPLHGENKKPNGELLSEGEKKEVEKLEKRDREVRAHEQAHLSAAGYLATGGPNYDYKTGPDGKQYASGGETPIKIPDAPTPEEDLRIAAQVERAALAPAKPSSADYAIASRARQKAAKAKEEIAAEQAGKFKSGDTPSITAFVFSEPATIDLQV